MPVLRCENLHKSFGGVQALGGVSLSFPCEGIVAIIGPNGAGKTTLLNVLTGFLRADTGRCFYGDQVITSLPAYRISRTGIVRTFQDLRLVQQSPVLENVLLARPHQRGERLLNAIFPIGVAAQEQKNRERAMELLDFVGLTSQASTLAGTLSWGQQKLLTLACCLAAEAQVLLLDEPVAGVHPQLIERILELLRKLRSEGRLIIFIEHDIAAVKQVADHLVVMDDGRVIAEGDPATLLESPEIMEAYVG